MADELVVPSLRLGVHHGTEDRRQLDGGAVGVGESEGYLRGLPCLHSDTGLARHRLAFAVEGRELTKMLEKPPCDSGTGTCRSGREPGAGALREEVHPVSSVHPEGPEFRHRPCILVAQDTVFRHLEEIVPGLVTCHSGMVGSEHDRSLLPYLPHMLDYRVAGLPHLVLVREPETERTVGLGTVTPGTHLHGILILGYVSAEAPGAAQVVALAVSPVGRHQFHPFLAVGGIRHSHVVDRSVVHAESGVGQKVDRPPVSLFVVVADLGIVHPGLHGSLEEGALPFECFVEGLACLGRGLRVLIDHAPHIDEIGIEPGQVLPHVVPLVPVCLVGDLVPAGVPAPIDQSLPLFQGLHGLAAVVLECNLLLLRSFFAFRILLAAGAGGQDNEYAS